MEEQTLNEITEYAAKLLHPDDIADILGMERHAFRQSCADTDTEIGRAYHKGFLLTKAALRGSVVSMAISGSSPAQSAAIKFLSDIEYELSKEI